MIKKIAILGAGNGGCAFSGHLAMKGFEVRLYEDPKFSKNIEEIRDRGGIELTGAVEGFGKLSNISTDIKDVVPGADIIMIVVPAFAQAIFMERTLLHLEDGQIVVFNPDNFASLVFAEMLKNKGIRKDIKIAGAACMMYAARRMAGAKVWVKAVKNFMPVAALPAKDTDSIINPLKHMFTEFTPAQSVIEVSIGNVNTIVHCAPAILNAGRIEDTKGDFMFYWQGMTESVCRVMEKMDEEKIAVAEKLGFKLISTLAYLRLFYPLEKAGKDLHDFVTNSKVHGGFGPNAPKDLQHRYLSEDVPYGLVPVSLFGKLVDVPTRATDSVIALSSIMNKIDYFEEGRSLEVLGLSGMQPEQILKYVQEGIR